MRFVFGLFLACSLFLASAVEGATIDFGSHVDDPFLSPDTYTEDGFTFAAVSGDQWGILSFVGNPASGLAVGVSDAIGIGDTISVTQVGGGLFTFDAFDYASFVNSLSDGVNFIGRVGAVQTESLLGVTSGTTVFVVGANPLFANPIDELLIVGASAGLTALELDNFVFTPIPEPATLLLLGTGLAAAGVRRRMKKRS